MTAPKRPSYRTIHTHDAKADDVLSAARAVVVTLDPVVVDRDAHIAAKAAVRDRTIEGFRNVYGEAFTPAVEALYRAQWDDEDAPVLTLVASAQVSDPGRLAIEAPDEDLDARVARLMAEFEDDEDTPEDEDDPDDPALDCKDEADES